MKSVTRLPPKLKTKLYQSKTVPKEAAGLSSSSTASCNIGLLETSKCVKNLDAKSEDQLLNTVPDVEQAIGQISNYFGGIQPSLDSSEAPSCQYVNTEPVKPTHPHLDQKNGKEVQSTTSESEVEVKTSLGDNEGGDRNINISTAIGQLSHETIGRLAGEIAEQIAGASRAPLGGENVKVPSYAPEKCSTNDSGYLKSLTCVEPNRGGVLLPKEESKSEQHESHSIGNVQMLKNVLVTEKDIFGSPHRSSCSSLGNIEKSSVSSCEIEEKCDVCDDSDAGIGGSSCGSSEDCSLAKFESDVFEKAGRVDRKVESDSDDGGGIEVSKEVVGITGSSDSCCGDGDDGKGSVVGSSDGTCYTLEHNKTREEFQKLTSIEEDSPLFGKNLYFCHCLNVNDVKCLLYRWDGCCTQRQTCKQVFDEEDSCLIAYSMFEFLKFSLFLM